MSERKNASPTVTYRKAAAEDLPVVRDLIREYLETLDLDLRFQGIEKELASLPGKYAEPKGALIVAAVDGEVRGCVALRDLGSGVCEMKRLYVAEGHKGLGLGRGLVAAVLAEARVKHYSRMRLDSLERMKSALSLYRSFGFRETAPYVYNPIEGAVFMEKDLDVEP
jgi:ribosomal protein S18 acetylase RimI-like enzyme